MLERTEVDRRAGNDRRVAYHLEHFASGGGEQRTYAERREPSERRSGWVRITTWSSSRKHWPKPQIEDGALPHTFLSSILK